MRGHQQAVFTSLRIQAAISTPNNRHCRAISRFSSAYGASGFIFVYLQVPGCFRQPGAGIFLQSRNTDSNVATVLSEFPTTTTLPKTCIQVGPGRQTCNVQGKVAARFVELPYPDRTLDRFTCFLLLRPINQGKHASTPAITMPRQCASRPYELFRGSLNVIVILLSLAIFSSLHMLP